MAPPEPPKQREPTAPPPAEARAKPHVKESPVHPVAWLIGAVPIAWRHKWPLIAWGAALAVLDLGFDRLLGSAPAFAEWLRPVPMLLASAAAGAYAYRSLLLREAPLPQADGWPPAPQGVARAVAVQVLGLLVTTLFVLALLGLFSLASSAAVDKVVRSVDPSARLAMAFVTEVAMSLPFLAALFLVGAPAILLLESAVALAIGDTVTGRRAAHAGFLAALGRMWRQKFSFILSAYLYVALAVILAFATAPLARAMGAWFEPALATILFVWWVGFVAVVNRTLN